MATDFRPVSRRSDLLLIASTTVVFLLISSIASLEKALAFAVAFSVFLAIVQTRKSSESNPRFWIVLSLLAVVHIVILTVVRLPNFQFGLIVLPFALADGFLMWWLLNRIDRRFFGEQRDRSR